VIHLPDERSLAPRGIENPFETRRLGEPNSFPATSYGQFVDGTAVSASSQLADVSRVLHLSVCLSVRHGGLGACARRGHRRPFLPVSTTRNQQWVNRGRSCQAPSRTSSAMWLGRADKLDAGHPRRGPRNLLLGGSALPPAVRCHEDLRPPCERPAPPLSRAGTTDRPCECRR
jgi:hypothetical protein